MAKGDDRKAGGVDDRERVWPKGLDHGRQNKLRIFITKYIHQPEVMAQILYPRKHRQHHLEIRYRDMEGLPAVLQLNEDELRLENTFLRTCAAGVMRDHVFMGDKRQTVLPLAVTATRQNSGDNKKQKTRFSLFKRSLYQALAIYYSSELAASGFKEKHIDNFRIGRSVDGRMVAHQVVASAMQGEFTAMREKGMDSPEEDNLFHYSVRLMETEEAANEMGLDEAWQDTQPGERRRYIVLATGPVCGLNANQFTKQAREQLLRLRSKVEKERGTIWKNGKGVPNFMNPDVDFTQDPEMVGAFLRHPKVVDFLVKKGHVREPMTLEQGYQTYLRDRYPEEYERYYVNGPGKDRVVQASTVHPVERTGEQKIQPGIQRGNERPVVTTPKPRPVTHYRDN